MATKKKVTEDSTQEAIDASIAATGEVPYQGYALVQVPAATKFDVMTNATVRSDDDALHGHAVKVVGGDHEGRYGVLRTTSSLGKDGYPDDVVIETFDPDALTLTVKYGDLRRSEGGLW